jgi:hypothetical protein
MAGDGGAGAGSVLRPETRAGAAVRVGLHAHDRAGNHARGQTFEHLVYHFVLTYSNWETGTICYSESLESLSEGWQNAVWELGAVAAEHRTDSLSSAVNNMSNQEEFNRRYEGGDEVLRGEAAAHQSGEPERERGCGAKPSPVQASGGAGAAAAREPRLWEQLAEYAQFLKDLFAQRNAGRRAGWPKSWR